MHFAIGYLLWQITWHCYFKKLPSMQEHIYQLFEKYFL